MRWLQDEQRFCRNVAEIIDELFDVERARNRRIELICEHVNEAVLYGRRTRKVAP